MRQVEIRNDWEEGWGLKFVEVKIAENKSE